MKDKIVLDKWLILIYVVIIGCLLLAFSCKKDEVIIDPPKPIDKTSCADCHEQFYYDKVDTSNITSCKQCHHEEVKIKGTCKYL